MTRLGRKPRGAAQVDSLWGSAHAKARLKAFLATLSGELGVDEACRQLELSSSRFFEQRTAWLHGAASGAPACRTNQFRATRCRDNSAGGG